MVCEGELWRVGKMGLGEGGEDGGGREGWGWLEEGRGEERRVGNEAGHVRYLIPLYL